MDSVALPAMVTTEAREESGSDMLYLEHGFQSSIQLPLLHLSPFARKPLFAPPLTRTRCRMSATEYGVRLIEREYV